MDEPVDDSDIFLLIKRDNPDLSFFVASLLPGDLRLIGFGPQEAVTRDSSPFRSILQI